jgi:hypothetical protein
MCCMCFTYIFIGTHMCLGYRDAGVCHMHNAYVIYTQLYLHVLGCICMYLYSLALYQVHICMYVVNIKPTYMQIHAHMHLSRQCISECMWLYFLIQYMQICMCIPTRIWLHHTCLIQCRLLTVASLMVHACHTFAVHSLHGHCTFAVLSLHVASRSAVAAAREATCMSLLRAEVWTCAFKLAALFVGRGSWGNYRRCAPELLW